jgi:hypothetical protein
MWSRDERGRAIDASSDDIRVTREMIDAGAAAIFEWREVSTAWDLAEIAYRAMERRRSGAETPVETP